MKVRAVGIFSGGLDSMLAVEVLRRQGVEVLAVTFKTPFFGSDRARHSAQILGVPHRVEDIALEHLNIVRDPSFGYGRQMNPCMDCHALMFRKAGEILDREAYHFIFSGEVLGQRPFSQNRRALAKVAQASGRADLILRPLSALCLPPSLPEQRGLLDRRRLLGLQGRSRKPQMKLAREWGIAGYPSPAGGCLLTDPIFSRRLRDLFENQPSWTHRDLQFLSLGRHLRISPEHKIIVGRNQGENERLHALATVQDILINAVEHPGPTVLVPDGADPAFLKRAASICLRYGDAPRDSSHTVECRQGGKRWIFETAAATPKETDRCLI
jgi:tRNA-specific 2-thiouridylase